MTQPLVARCKFKNKLSCRAIFGASLFDDRAQNLAVTLRRNRQPVLEIPGRKVAFAGIVAKFNLALFQRLPIGRADDRQQHAGPGAVRQDRKSTRLNSSHMSISYAVFCLKKKK